MTNVTFSYVHRQLACCIGIFQTALDTKGVLAGLKAEGSQLIGFAEGLSKCRNAFIHAAVTPIAGEPEFEAIVVAVRNCQYHGQEHRFSVNDAAELNHHVATLQMNLAPFMAKVSDTLEAESQAEP